MKNNIKFIKKLTTLLLIIFLLSQTAIPLISTVKAVEPDSTWQSDWMYVLNEQESELLLLTYRGQEKNYTIPSKATINGKTYTTLISGLGLSELQAAPFLYGTSIENVSFENGVKLGENLQYAFASETLKTINFDGLDFSNVKYMGEWLSHCKKITKIDLSNKDLSNVESLDDFLKDTQNIEELNLSNVNLSKLTNLNYTFKDNEYLKKVNMSGVNLSNVTSMNSIFEGCINLEEVDLSGITAPKLEYTDKMFKNCSSLEKLSLENLNRISNDSKIIENCSQLSELKLKNIASIETNAFLDNDVLSDLTLEKCNVKNNAFKNCANLKNITFIGNQVELEDGAFYLSPESYRTAFVSYKDDTGLNAKEVAIDSEIPVYTTTIIKTDDSKILSYPWGEDNRLVSDGKEYSLTYDVNGGEGQNNTVPFTAGDKIKEDIPQRTEYNFCGWNTKQDGSGKLYVPNEKINFNNNATLYAQWRKKGYTNSEKTEGWCGENVKWSYDANSKKLTIYTQGNGNGRMYNQLQRDDVEYSVPWANLTINTIEITEGVTYIGNYAFYRDASTESLILPNSLEEIGECAFYNRRLNTVTNLQDKVKVGRNAFNYVNQEYKITADANGGKFSNNSDKKEYTSIIKIEKQLPENSAKTEIQEPTREGYKFIGWNTKQDGTGKFVNNPYLLNTPRDTSLYAIWADKKITVTFNANGGNFSNNTQSLYQNENLIESVPTKSNYVFSEWNTKQDGTGTGFQPGQEFDLKEDTTLYAIWREPYVLKIKKNSENRGEAHYLIDENNNEIRVFHFEAAVLRDGDEFVEVSEDYLKNYFKEADVSDTEIQKFITLIATLKPFNEAGLDNTLDDIWEFYNNVGGTYPQYMYKILDSTWHTSNSGAYWLQSHDLRMLFIDDHYQDVAKGYKLRVFKHDNKILVTIEKIEVQEEKEEEKKDEDSNKKDEDVPSKNVVDDNKPLDIVIVDVDDNSNDENSPQTGDKIFVVAIIIIVSVAGIVVTYIINKKSK